MNKLKFFSGVMITIFNACVFIFTQNEINPSYFELLFAIYYFVGLVWGIKLIHDGLEDAKRSKHGK